MSNYYVYYQNPKSGEIHRAMVSEGNRFTKEQCNLDDAGHEYQVTEEAALQTLLEKPEAACGHCMKAKE